MKAVDCQGFAGGFTLGAHQAGFTLVGKRELPGGFGVASVEANRHILGDDWQTQIAGCDAWDVVDAELVFGNPPCSAFSMLGRRRMDDDPITSCMTAFVDYTARVMPRFAVFESVQAAFHDGRELMRRLHERLEQRSGQTWFLHHVLHDGGRVGGAAQRRRYFWLVTREPFAIPRGHTDYTLLSDVLSDLEGLELTTKPQPYAVPDSQASTWAMAHRSPNGLVDGHALAPPSSDARHVERYFAALAEIGGEWPQGTPQSKTFADVWARAGNRADELLALAGPPRFIAAARAGETIKPGYFQSKRWSYAKPGRVVPGDATRRIVHPVEQRHLTLREVFRIQGFVDDWRIGAQMDTMGNTPHLWPGKGIPVQAGKWICDIMMQCMSGDVPDSQPTETDGRENVWRTDLSSW